MRSFRAPHGHAFAVAKTLCFPFIHWNWKSAILSALIRSLGYLIATRKHGLHTGFHAAIAEVVYVALTAGVYSALQQGALDIRPRWLSNSLIVVGVPVLSQSVEYAFHSAIGTPNLRVATFSIMLFGFLSAMFHLHVMRNGAMLVGGKSRPFFEDLKRMPILLAGFLATPVVTVAEVTRRQWENDKATA